MSRFDPAYYVDKLSLIYPMSIGVNAKADKTATRPQRRQQDHKDHA